MTHTAYFGNIDWYRKLIAGGGIDSIDGTERWQKQTERNRCTIVTANGTQCLSVPVTVPSAHCRTDEVLISDHGNWQHVHWNALCSAYGTSPFFEFYADDIKPFYDNRWEKLVDYNRDITLKMLHLIGLDDVISAQSANAGALTANAGAHTANDGAPTGEPRSLKYYQTFQRRHGFIEGMSILDLLFNEGPEAIKYI